MRVALVAAALATAPASLRAAVVVISNRTAQPVEFDLVNGGGSPQRHRLDSFDLIAVPVAGAVKLRLPIGEPRREYGLQPSAIYFFSTGTDGLEFREIGLGPPDVAAEAPAPKDVGETDPGPDGFYTIPVKVLVDEEEPAVPELWERRLRRRLAAASDVFERHCRVRFKVVATGTWQSDDAIDDFVESLREFERDAQPAPARLVVGFTSQYELVGHHLGATRTPLYSHILIRERHRKYSEPERLEVLVHELGHFLGAAHSPEADSVMRPALADDKSVARRFRIQFDPLNTLAINLVADEMRRLDTWVSAKLSGETREQLMRVYTEIDRAFPEDPAAARYRAILSATPLPQKTTVQLPSSILGAVREVRAAVVAAAERNHAQPPAGADRLSGDALTEMYFRVAAEAAGRLPQAQAAVAMPVGLAVALNPSARDTSLLGQFGAIFESADERQRRLEVIGGPTMWGRGDLAQHFVLSAALAAFVGTPTALQAGLTKELSDSNGGSGFSFADLTADLAGIAFAERLKRLEALGEPWPVDFKVESYLPDPRNLPEGLTRKAFAARYGSVSDARFRDFVAEIRGRIEQLPSYERHGAE